MEVNRTAERDEKTRKDTRKNRREERLATSTSSLVCESHGCSFVGTSKAGLVNHIIFSLLIPTLIFTNVLPI